MKFTLDWLRTHLDTDAGLDAITGRLTAIGLELEGVEDPGAALAPFRIARVTEAVQHPNADRLRACTVDAGDGPVSVVCGAPNARAGMLAVFAPPGSFIPGTGITLKVGEIRGVQSAGMLLSRREMGLGEDHDGILELPEGAPVGAPYAAWAGLGDPVIEISVTPNRGDALSIRGVARDLAAAGMGTLRPWRPVPSTGAAAVETPWELLQAGFPEKSEPHGSLDHLAYGPSAITWAINMPEACPWVLGRTVRGVRNGPSPEWLQRRLLSIGLRPISTLVDVTNFFTYDLGRPLHVFDADKVHGGVLTMRPGAGESFRALNGKDYTADPADCVIADSAGVQSLAGVIGGEATGCTGATTSVFIECALFDPVRVALTGRRHAIASDARQRFERGVDQALLPAALDAATLLIQHLCGGEFSEAVSAGAEPTWQRSATLRFERLASLGGMAVPPDMAEASLIGLGFTVQSRTNSAITVAVPSWRNDIAAPIHLDQSPTLSPDVAAAAAEGCAAVEAECDLVEEVLRLQGLDNIPPVSLPALAPVPPAVLTLRQARTALARRTLAASGLLECVSFSFMDSTKAAAFGDAPESLRLLNPIASDLDQLRATPVATLTLAAGRNAARGWPDARLFEVGPAFDPQGQQLVAAGVLTGHTPRHPLHRQRPMGAMDAKASVIAVLAALGLPMDSLGVTTDAPAFYHPGRSGVVRQGPKLILATFGELHPRVTQALDLPGPAAAFEVFLDRIPEPKRRRRAAPDLPAFQPVRRDFAFLVDAATPADAVLRAARGAERTLIAGASIFDVYAGENVPAGQKSVGIEVVFQPRERTLTEAEIDAAAAKVVAAVTKATGGTMR
ncbi:MAG TPA: phenylalanine--tRNA ligase subunit beta [Acetobacteraceae bacterium]